ncbi:unnamed protein product [Cylicocyclus nassatus]|uniref:Uncharacterized protein n=1 Tax=Cylicocyclus nassatus TaxID=53992 RepID=A0AA36DSV7_CYLNA|nr:unnamed protein product [Cylicocyclus nassatus]
MKLDICCADEAASPDLIVTKNETCTVRDVKGIPHPRMGAMLVSRSILPVIVLFCITELDAQSVRHVRRPKRTQRHISSLPILTIELVSPIRNHSPTSRNRRMQTPKQVDYAYHYNPHRVYSDLNDIYAEKPRRARAHLYSQENDDSISYVPRFSMRLPKRSQRSAYLQGVRGVDGERVLPKLPFISTSLKRTEPEPLPKPRPALSNLNRNVIPNISLEPTTSGINAGVEGFGFSQDFINIDAVPKITVNGKDGAITTTLLLEGTGTESMQANATANNISNRAIKHSSALRTEATPASNPDETTEEKALTQLESPNEIREVYGLPNQDVEFVTEVKQLPNKEAPDGVSSIPKRRKSKPLPERETIHINRRI